MNFAANKTINNRDFAKIMETATKSCFEYLLKEGKEFTISANNENVDFTPNLPLEILNTFNNVIIFNISNYSFETFVVKDDYISFEAGFGNTNPIGSTVTIDIKNIHTVLIDNNIPLIVNLTAGLFNEKDVITEDVIDQDGINKSTASFLMNPENAKFFKK